jgi:hypothetical protein
MSLTVIPPRLKQNSLLDRIGDMDCRIHHLATTAGIGDEDKILSDKMTTTLRALRTGTVRQGVRRRRTLNDPRLSLSNRGSHPALVEDILLMVIELISPRVNLEQYRSSNDISTLKAMRL